VEWYGLSIETDDRMKAEEALRTSEYNLHKIIETVPGLIWSNGSDGEPTHVNQRMLDYSGMQFEDFTRRGWQEFVHPADYPETALAFYHAIRTGTSYEGVLRLRRADGEFRWHHARCEPLRDQQGCVIQWYGLSVDIDERKKAEDLLRRSEAYLAEAQRLSRTGTWAFNPTTNAYVYWSEESYRIWGIDPLEGLPSRETIRQRAHPDDRERVYEGGEEAVRQKRDYAVAYRIVLPDGDIKYLEAVSRHLFSTNGELVEVIGSHVDVTERKRVDDALREREAELAEARRELRQMIDTIPIPLASYSADDKRDFVNVAWKQYTGLSDETALGCEWFVVAHPDHIATGEKMWRDALASGRSYHTEERVRRAGGTYRWFAIDRVAARDKDGKIIKWYETAYDIEDRKRAEDALRESETRFRDYAETASDWFWEIGQDYKFTLLTENAFGPGSPNRIGTACWDHALDLETEPEKWRLIWEAIDTRKPFRDFVYRVLDGEGSPMHVRVSGKPMFNGEGEFRGYRGTGTDVTALIRAQEEHERLRRLESDLAHMNRLSMMGELAASLAHEIAQPIAAARNNARAAMHFLEANPPDQDQGREALACVVDDADRAGGILDRIRDHIKKAPPRKERVDVNQAITDVIVLAQGVVIKNGVSLQTRLTKGLPSVLADRVQIQQVVLNLILNAVEAMSSLEKGARELTVITERHQAGGLVVTVRDTGPGIASEHLEQVFEAFYTTKSSGVGMGLSICRSIVDAHGGRLWADVHASIGAVFRFTLPGAVKDLTCSFRSHKSNSGLY
jgi:PAS domain S-box-containing protein